MPKKVAGTEPGAPAGPAPVDERQRWDAAAHELARFAKVHSDHYGGFVTDADYLALFGCPEDCNIELVPGTPHKHVKGRDTTPALLVTYKGSWQSINHRRGRGSRFNPVYIFTGGGVVPVRVTYPADKFSYIRRHLANPEEWGVAWDGEN